MKNDEKNYIAKCYNEYKDEQPEKAEAIKKLVDHFGIDWAVTGFKRGRWWVTAGVLAGIPSLFWYGWGSMQNFYGTLLLTIGTIYLRRGNRWSKLALALSTLVFLILLVVFDFLLRGIISLWVIGSLTTMVYSSLIMTVHQSLNHAEQHHALKPLKICLVVLLATHILYMILASWRQLAWLGVLPMLAQLNMLVLLWKYGRIKSTFTPPTL